MSELFTPHQDIHLIEAWGVRESITNSARNYKRVSSGFVCAMGLTILGKPEVFTYPDVGLSFKAFLSESMIGGHTYPQHDYLNYLLHTCKKDLDFSSIEQMLKVLSGATEVRNQLLYSCNEVIPGKVDYKHYLQPELAHLR